MAKIAISDLRSTDSELFQDSASFLHDLTDIDSMSVHGGVGYGFSEFLNFGVKVLEFALVGFAISNIVSLVQSFMAPRAPQS
ncbi:MAG: hypothetical protein ACM37W_16715 [Actinomycetota bacterium]